MAIEDAGTGAFSAISRAASSQYMREFSNAGREERQERRLRAKQRNAELRNLQQQEQLADDQFQVAQQELQLLQQQNQQTMGINAKQTVYSAFDRYTADRDPRHLNAMLKDLQQNPQGQQLFGKAARADKITEADRQLLRQSNIDPELVFNNPEVHQDLIKVTDSDGKVSIESMSELEKMTGYHRYASNRELDRLKRQAEIQSLYRNYGYKTADERAAHRMAVGKGFEPGSEEYQEAFNAAYTEISNRSAQSEFRTKDEREALRRVQDDYNLEPGQEGFEEAYNEVFSQITTRDRQTAPSREQDEVEITKDRLEETASGMGYQSYFEIPMGQLEPSQRARLERDVQRIERLAKVDFDAQTKRRFGYIKQLLAVGDPMGDLTSEQTGIIDRFTKDVGSYLTDNVEGKEASAAYAAYKNTIRHALYGSALTEAEIKAFNSQFGNLSQQTGPVLAKMRVALTQLKAEMENLYQVNDSYVAHFRLGMDTEKLNQVIGSLDERIEYFRRAQSDIANDSGELSEDQARGLDELYNQTGGNNED